MKCVYRNWLELIIRLGPTCAYKLASVTAQHSCKSLTSCATNQPGMPDPGCLTSSENVLDIALYDKQLMYSVMDLPLRHAPACMPAAVEPQTATKTGGVARWWRNKFSSKKTRKSTPSYTALQVLPSSPFHLGFDHQQWWSYSMNDLPSRSLY